LRGDEETPPVDVTTPPTPPPPTVEWSRIPHDEAIFGGDGDQMMTGIATDGTRLVAVGTTVAGFAERDAAIWTSDDGIGWARVPHEPDVLGGPGSQEMTSIAAGGPGFVAVGYRFDEPGRLGLYAGVWISPDGLTWTSVTTDHASLADAAMYDVISGGPGLVAVGSDATVWTSVNGLEWTKVFSEPRVNERQTEMTSVTATDSGFVAVGASGIGASSSSGSGSALAHDPGSTRAAVWSSVDGIAWSRLPHDEEVFGGAAGEHCRMNDVVKRGPGLVAGGICEWYSVTSSGADGLSSDGGRPFVWISPDGASWSRHRIPDDALAPGPNGEIDQGISSMAVFGSRLLAVGTASWISTDGVTWQELNHDHDVQLRDVVMGGAHVLAVGGFQSREGEGAAVFLTPIE
jgi:hypothetical protein